MQDLYLGMLAMTGVSVLALAAGLALGRMVSRLVSTAVIVLVICGMFLFYAYLQDSAAVANLLPYSGLPVLGNWLPPLAGLLLGLAARHIPGGVLRKSLTLAPLGLVGLYSAYAPLFRPPPFCGNQWNGEYCMQTSAASCTPAAAATLLRRYGIHTTEHDMARLCLTHDRGTSNHGLFRGLTLMTAGTGLRVEAFAGDVALLREKSADGPVMITARLENGSSAEPRYAADWGWKPGVGHTVVLLGFTPDGRAHIADPASVGTEYWDRRAIQELWTGDGMRIRPSSSSTGSR